jgi:hypothetical protein
VKRRAFIAVLGGAAVWPLVARAQQPDRVWRIGVLIAHSESDPEFKAYLAAFREVSRNSGGQKAATFKQNSFEIHSGPPVRQNG